MKTTPFLAVIVALMGAGCAQKPVPVTLERPIRTLGVASNCGQTMTREALAWFNVGLHDYTTMDVRGWGLDQSIRQTIETQTGGAVTTVGVFADLPAISAWRGESVFGGPTQADMLRANIKTPAQPVDAYLLYIQGLRGENSNITGPQSVDTRYGIGLFSRIRSRFAHVYCDAVLVDGKTFKALQRETISQVDVVDSELILDRWADYTPEQLGRVRTILTGLWNKGIADMVARMPLRSGGA